MNATSHIQKRVRKNKKTTVYWKTSELGKLLLAEPRLKTAQGAELRRLLTDTQTLLPADRQRPANSIFVCTVNSPLQWEKLLQKGSEYLSTLSDEEKGELMPVKGNVVWTEQEMRRIADFPQVRQALYDKLHGSGKASKIVAAIMELQDQGHIPRSRRRNEETIKKSIYRRHLLSDLYVAANMEPAPAIATSEPPPQAMEEVQEVQEVEVMEVMEEAAVPAPALSAAPPPAPPPPPFVDPMQAALGGAFQTIIRSIAESLAGTMAETLKKTMMDALASVDLPTREAVEQSVEATVLRLLGGAVPESAPEAKPEPLPQPIHAEPYVEQAPRPKKIKAVVVGLMGSQPNIVTEALGDGYDIRFVLTKDARNINLRGIPTVLATKFISHAAQDKMRSNGCDLIYANGGPGSVVAALRGLGS